jgi:hypothetical protein
LEALLREGMDINTQTEYQDTALCMFEVNKTIQAILHEQQYIGLYPDTQFECLCPFPRAIVPPTCLSFL